MARAGARTAAATPPRKRKARNASVRPGDVRVRPLPTRVDWNDVLEMVRAGWSTAEVARAFGYDRKTVQNRLRELGAEPERKWRRTAEPFGTRVYALWRFARLRCEDPESRDYKDFGAQGVRFATEWHDFDAFYDWAMRAGYRPGLRFLRIDPTGHFVPGNCRFGTAREAYAARRAPPPQRWLRAFGERKGLVEWTRDPRCTVSRASLRNRLAGGWAVEDAIGLPPGSQPSRRVRPSRASGRKRPGHVDWEEAPRLYARGQSVDRLAARYDVVVSTIVDGLRRRGVRLRRRGFVAPDEDVRRLRWLWRTILERCENPRNSFYHRYGGRGIRVVRAWRDFERFHAWARASGWSPGLKLVRKEKSKGYSPSNCEWTTASEASRYGPPRGERPPVRLVTAFGETKGAVQWSRDPRCDVHLTTILARLAKGWPPEDAVALPPHNRGSRDRPKTAIEAFGSVKSMADWVRDRRCRVTATGLGQRLRRGWTPEDAIATPPHGRPGERGRGAGASDARRTRRRRRPA